MTTANNYMSGMAQQSARNARLNKDQQKLSEAAAGNIQDNNSGGITAQGIAETGAHLKDNVQFAGQGVNLASKLFGAGKTVFNVGRSGFLAPLTIADYTVAALSEDGKGLYEKTGDYLGDKVSKALYGDTSQPAMNEGELQAIKDGNNPLKPITEAGPAMPYNPMQGGYTPSGGNSKIVGYEPMSQKPQNELDEAARNELGSQFEGSALMPDGSTKGYLVGGGSRTMTQEEMSAFENNMKTGEYTGVPMGEYQNVPDTQGQVRLPAGQSVPMTQDQYIKQYSALQNAARDSVFKDFDGADGKSQRDLQNQYFNQERFQQPTEAPSAPQTSSGLSPLADEVLTEYAEFKESGEPMTADKQAYFETIGGMTGRTFDANDGGFSKEFNPQIMENFQQRVDEGVIDTSGLGREEFQKYANTDRRSTLEKATDELDARQAESTRNYDSNRPSSIQTMEFRDTNQNGVEDRAEGISFNRNPNQMREDFGQVFSSGLGTKLRLGGEMVDATPENRALRDQETALKGEADELGLRGGARRAFIADKMRERSEAQQDRATNDRINELNIQNTQESMNSRRIRDELALQSANKVETPTLSPSVLKSAQDFFEKNGVTFDPETGALQTTNKRFLLPDGKVNLSPDSPLVALIRGTNTGVPMEGAEAFLAPPPSVISKLQEAEAGQLIRSDDGRVYQVLENKKTIQVL